MTNKEIKEQLEDLQDYCRGQHRTSPNTATDKWLDDIVALGSAIRVYERKEKQIGTLGMKIMLVIDTLIILGAILLILFTVGGHEIGRITNQGFVLRILSSGVMIAVASLSAYLTWKGVGDE